MADGRVKEPSGDIYPELLPRVRMTAMNLPKLNLRDLFWLIVVVAMGLGWWMERRTTVAASMELRQQITHPNFTTVTLSSKNEALKRQLSDKP
jgi:hypothetical protein